MKTPLSPPARPARLRDRLPAIAAFALLACLLVSLMLVSCQDFFGKERMGKLCVNIPELYPPSTRAETGAPDVGTFLVTVTDASGSAASG